MTYRTSTALAELLGTAPVEFPGDHGGFIGAPDAFADTLREVLAAARPRDRRNAGILSHFAAQR